MGPLRRQEAKRLLKNLHEQGDFNADAWLDRLTDVLSHTPEVVNVCARQLALWNEEVKEQLKFTATPEGSYGAIAEVVLDAAAVYNGEPTDQDKVVDGWHVGDKVQWHNHYGDLRTGTIVRIYLDSRAVVIMTPEGGHVDAPMDSLIPAPPEPPIESPLDYDTVLMVLQRANIFLRAAASGRTNKSHAEVHASNLSKVIETLKINRQKVTGNDMPAGDDG